MSKKAPKPVPDMTEVFADLLVSSADDSVDRRRLYMLKCQQAQLERQLLILCESLSSRREYVSSLAENTDRLLAFCRESISKEERGPSVMIERARLIALVERCRVVQGALHKEVEDLLSDRHILHNLIPNRFQRPQLPLRDLLLSSRGLASLNLSRVRKLEGDLSNLYSHLSALSLASGTIFETSLVPMTSRRRYDQLISTLLPLLRSLCKDVSELSLLLPSMPPTPPSLQSQGRRIDLRRHLGDIRNAESRIGVETAIRSLQQESESLKKERDALREELDACRKQIEGQARDVNSLVDGLKVGYQNFRSDFRETVVDPLGNILDAFDEMDEKADRKSLQRFLESCRENFPAVRIALNSVQGELSAGDGAADPLFAEFRRRLLQQHDE